MKLIKIRQKSYLSVLFKVQAIYKHVPFYFFFNCLCFQGLTFNQVQLAHSVQLVLSVHADLCMLQPSSSGFYQGLLCLSWSSALPVKFLAGLLVYCSPQLVSKSQASWAVRLP